MIQKNLNINVKYFIELTHFLFFLNKNFNFFLFYKNSSIFTKIINFRKKTKILFKFLFFKNELIGVEKKLFNKYNNFKITSKAGALIDFKENTHFSLKSENFNVNNFILKKKNDLPMFLFNIFFLFNYSMFNSKFKAHNQFNFYSIINIKNKIIIINSAKFLMRWTAAYNLLFNVFYYNFNPTFFSGPTFKKQTLSLNWNYNTWNIDLWKYYAPFFVFQPNKYNKKINFFFSKLKTLNANFFIITDCFYHYKNLFYFKKNDYYTIGLINVNNNPWLVTYPIISFFDNFLIQLFFFKLIIYLQKQAFFAKYTCFKRIWLQTVIMNQ